MGGLNKTFWKLSWRSEAAKVLQHTYKIIAVNSKIACSNLQIHADMDYVQECS